MNMIDSLPTIVATVAHDTVARLGKPFPLGDRLRQKIDAADEFGVSFFQIHHRRNMLMGYDEEMYGSRGMNVLNGKQGSVIVNFLSWQIAGRNFAKQTVFGSTHNPSFIACWPRAGNAADLGEALQERVEVVNTEHEVSRPPQDLDQSLANLWTAKHFPLKDFLQIF